MGYHRCDPMKNLITDEGAAQIAATYAPFASSDNPRTRSEVRFHLGLPAWRSGDVAGLRAHLRAGAGDWLTFAESLPPGSRLTALAQAPLMMLMTAVFGDDEHRARLSRLPQGLYADPDSPGRTGALDQVRAYFAGGDLDAAAWDEVGRAQDADRLSAPMVRSFATGMSAVALRNEILAARSLDAIAQHHAWLAHEGEWARLAEGLLSFWGAALACAARAEGVVLSAPTDSFRGEYVPDFDPAIRRKARAKLVDGDVLPAHTADAARVLAARIASTFGIDVSNDRDRMARLAGAHASAAAELRSQSASVQRLPFFAVVEDRPLALAITFHAGGRFDIAKMGF
jgi:hypothetical protein